MGPEINGYSNEIQLTATKSNLFAFRDPSKIISMFYVSFIWLKDIVHFLYHCLNKEFQLRSLYPEFLIQTHNFQV